jgi:hypothetical protein
MFHLVSKLRALKAVRPSGSRRPGFAPRLEACEERCVMNVSFSVSGTTLSIDGNSARNVVVINDNGTNQAGNITVTADGDTFIPGGVIHTVVVDGEGGDDSVTYNLNANLGSSVSHAVQVSLDGGDDAFTANLRGDLLSGSSLGLTAWGETGADDLHVYAGSDVDMALNSRLSLTLDGGWGNDHVHVVYNGEMDGTIDMYLNGDADKDEVWAQMTLDAGSAGKVGQANDAARVRGGTDDDDLVFEVHNNGSAQVFAWIEGYTGNDTGRRTTNVTPYNLETDFVVP